MKTKKYQKSELKKWSKKTWTAFSLYIRTKYVNFQGYVQCYTCEKWFPLKETQAGHCFHKGNGAYKALDFDENHIKPQCGGCNVFTGGSVNKFQHKLTQELGLTGVEEMIKRRATEKALTVEELQFIYEQYTKLLKLNSL